MMRFHTLVGLAAALLASTPAAAQRPPLSPAQAEALQEAEARALERWTSPTLTRFTGEAEFRRYVRAVREHPEARPRWWALGRHIQFAQAQVPADAQSDSEPPLCPPEDPTCAGAADNASIVLTGTRARSNSITNNQEAGVDEGDIVKQIGQYLLVLQDGRIFVVDTRGGGGRGLALADRINVYRNAEDDMWYDEMLVEGDHVLVTGYSYDEQATEVSVFRLDSAGRLSRRGVFFLSSDDYYDGDNYATRLVGDNLVVYAPMSIASIDPDEPIKWPLVRRWVAGEDREQGEAHGIPLFDARTIYRPVRTATDPVVHTVSVCPLGPAGAGRDLRCRTAAFAGPARREYYVSPTDVYLWITPDQDDLGRESTPSCRAGERLAPAGAIPALLYRVPVSGEEPGVLGTVGTPIDQFSLAAGGSRFRALLRLRPRPRHCEAEYAEGEGPPLVFFDVRLDRFGETLARAPMSGYTPLPGAGAYALENRFTDAFLVYGGRASYGSYPPESDNEARPDARVVAVPLDRPRDATVMRVPHDVIRAERAGDDIVLTGYHDWRGLQVSLIGLDGAPRVASTARLDGRYESEGRSHAFNSLMERDGSGIMGLPTVRRDFEAGRYVWHSNASDLSYLTADPGRRLAAAGELIANEDADEGTGYRCEVSCIDWYGNSRPIFTDGRVFALSGVELIEGRLEGGRIHEVQRLNIAGSRSPPALR